ncbi:hypothetical protein Tco_0032857 [Tanacetum coccineum]
MEASIPDTTFPIKRQKKERSLGGGPWSAPLSTPYPPTTLESSLGSSSERDSYLPEDSGEEHMEVDTADVEAVADVCISDGVVAHLEDSIDMGFEIAASDVREDDEEFEAKASAADTREIVVDPLAISDSSESSRGEVCIDRITKIKTTQRQLETSQLVASGKRASLVERIGSLRLEYLKVRAMLSIEIDRIDSRFSCICHFTESFFRTPEAIKELLTDVREEHWRLIEEAHAARNATRGRESKQNGLVMVEIGKGRNGNVWK